MSSKNKVLLVVLLGIAVVVVITLVRLRSPVAPAPAEVHPDGDAGVRIFGRNAWLDSCLGACRASGPRRLPHLSPEKRQLYCNINCECGLEKMTEPGPKPDEVRAPSAFWMKMTEQQQMDAAQDCQKRSEAMTASHPPDGAP